MATSWVPLLFATLQAQAVKLGHYAAPGSWCHVLSTQKVSSPQEEDKFVDTNTFIITAALVNLDNAVYESGVFILPSEAPIEEISTYRAVMEDVDHYYHVRSKARTPTRTQMDTSHPRTAIMGAFWYQAGQAGKDLTAEPADDVSAPIPLVSITPTSTAVPRSVCAMVHHLVIATTVQNTDYYQHPSDVDWATLMDEEDDETAAVASFDDSSEDGSTHSSSLSTLCPSDTELDSQDSEKIGTAIQFPNLRQYVPDNINDELEVALKQLDSRQRETSLGLQYARGVVEWRHMCRASQDLLSSGQSRSRGLEHADRSVAWFWDAGAKPSTPGVESDPSFRTKTLGGEPLPERRIIHHVNFSGRAVEYRSTTPPEVSFWAAFSSAPALRYPDARGSLRKQVLASQAGRYLDPFMYSGSKPPQPSSLRGTALKDFVTGYVDKVYPPTGIWISDYLGTEEDRPRCHTDVLAGFYHSRCPQLNLRMQSYIISKDEDCDTIVNDDGRLHEVNPSSDLELFGIGSNLVQVEFCDYGLCEQKHKLLSHVDKIGAGLFTTTPPDKSESSDVESESSLELSTNITSLSLSSGESDD